MTARVAVPIALLGAAALCGAPRLAEAHLLDADLGPFYGDVLRPLSRARS